MFLDGTIVFQINKLTNNIVFKIFLILIFFVAGIAIAGPMDDAERHFIKKEYSFAIDAAKEAMTFNISDENKARCHYIIGQAYLQRGMPQTSRKTFSIIGSQYPKTTWLANAYVGIGDSYYREKLYQKAIDNYKKSMTSRFLNQAGSTVYYKLARSYRALKNENSAKYNEGIIRKNYPDSLEAKLLLSGSSKSSSTKTIIKKTVSKSTKSITQSTVYAVQICYTPYKGAASNLANKYKTKGYTASVKETSYKGKARYKVLIGKYKSKSSAESLMKKLKKNGEKDAFVTKI